MELLADELRPKCLDDIVGQEHLVGNDKIIRNLVNNKKLFSMILYGPPGVGKTSLATAIVNELNVKFRMLNAVINNKNDFDVVIEEAKMYGNLVLIVDEIHRMNKDKQDLLLSYIESGKVILIGLTNSNPYHSINQAIRSRCEMIELKSISEIDIYNSLDRVKEVYEDIILSDDVKHYISKLSNGDMRYAYNLIEFCYNGFGKEFSIEDIKEINNNMNYFHDKNEDGYYDVISAFQKSIRGSDVDASIHYLVRLIEAGDFDILYRRMLVIVYEDIGLANPTLPTKVLTAIEAAERLGLPEMYKPLTQAVIEMSLSPKSNSNERTYMSALNDLKRGNTGRVPKHIRTYNENLYKYPHNYKNHYVKQQYLPDTLVGSIYYTPGDNKIETSMYEFNKQIKNTSK